MNIRSYGLEESLSINFDLNNNDKNIDEASEYIEETIKKYLILQ